MSKPRKTVVDRKAVIDNVIESFRHACPSLLIRRRHTWELIAASSTSHPRFDGMLIRPAGPAIWPISARLLAGYPLLPRLTTRLMELASTTAPSR
jgi:hypothetical protein